METSRARRGKQGTAGSARPGNGAGGTGIGRLVRRETRHYQLYLLILLPLIYIVIFAYVPMYGVALAFKDYNAGLGITASPWVGMKHFNRFFKSYDFWRILRNTLTLSLYSLAAGFPFPILLALCINSCGRVGYKKAVQMSTYAPYFLSTTVVVGMLNQFLAEKTGVVNAMLFQFTGARISFLTQPGAFAHLYVWSGVWQGMGYSSIIYIAALAGIDPTLHEAAMVDGANRFHRAWYIDIPGILPTATILLVMSLGSIMSVGFEKVYLMQNSMNISRSQIISTYIYPLTRKEADGKYHVWRTNHGESFWGGRDTMDTLNGMHGIFPLAIRMAQLLDTDADMIPVWRDMADNIAPLPTDNENQPNADPTEARWITGRDRALFRGEQRPAFNPMLYFDMCNLETEHANPQYFHIGRNLIADMERIYDQAKNTGMLAREMSPFPRIFAAMGEGGLLCDLMPRQLDAQCAADEHCFFTDNGSQPVYRNRLTAREGVNAISAQRLGNVAAGVQQGLLQCSGGAPTLPPVLRVFPAWRKGWDAEFTLFARGGFEVSAKQQNGVIEYVRVTALRDADLTLVNPWKNGAYEGDNLITDERICRRMAKGDVLELRGA